MAHERIVGISVVPPRTDPDPAAPRGHSVTTLAAIEEMERIGVQAVWLTTDFSGLDPLVIFAAAAARTERVKMGTCIVPTWPRHPIATVQQSRVIAQLAPGRFRLGVGPSHKPPMEEMFGYEFRRPLTNLREYLLIAKNLLQLGEVDFDGYHYHAHARIPGPEPGVPVMAAALREKSFELCGELADGAISWNCPAAYIRDVALPAMEAGAKKANRPVPPMVAHAPVCVHDDADEIRKAAREQLPIFSGHPMANYARMIEAAGYPEVPSDAWSEGLFEDLVLHGNEEQVADQAERLFDLGVSEILAVPLAAGDDPAGSRARTVQFLADLAKR